MKNTRKKEYFSLYPEAQEMHFTENVEGGMDSEFAFFNLADAEAHANRCAPKQTVQTLSRAEAESLPEEETIVINTAPLEGGSTNAPTGYEAMTKAEIMALLDEQQIEYNSKATKAELIALLPPVTE